MVRKHISEQSWDGGHAGKGTSFVGGHLGKGITSIQQLGMFGVGKSSDVRSAGTLSALGFGKGADVADVTSAASSNEGMGAGRAYVGQSGMLGTQINQHKQPAQASASAPAPAPAPASATLAPAPATALHTVKMPASVGVRQPARAGRDGETPKHSDFTPQSPVYY